MITGWHGLSHEERTSDHRQDDNDGLDAELDSTRTRRTATSGALRPEDVTMDELPPILSFMSLQRVELVLLGGLIVLLQRSEQDHATRPTRKITINELNTENQWILCWRLKSRYCSNLLWKDLSEASRRPRRWKPSSRPRSSSRLGVHHVRVNVNDPVAMADHEPVGEDGDLPRV